MPSINLDLDYFSHPKVVRLNGILGAEGSTFPIRLWVYAAKYHCADGFLEGYTIGELESVMGWTGETGKCVAAMEHVRFIHKIDGGYAIHEWKEHAAHLIVFKKRAKTAAKKRWASYASSIASKKSSIAQKDSSNALTFHNRALQDNTKDTPPAPYEGTTAFDEFWKAYPKKTGKKAALQAWRKAKEKPELVDIIQAIESQKKTDQWMKENGQFIPNPSTWLNQGRWADEVAPPAAVVPMPLGATCESRVQRGNFLKPCGEPAIATVGNRPICQQHKEEYDVRRHIKNAAI